MGALTSKPYAFRARPWELRSYDTHDFLDAFTTAIRIELRAGQLLRVTPRPDFKLKSEWINDRTRYFIDGLKRQRLALPMTKLNTTWNSVSWKFALDTFKFHFQPGLTNIDGILGQHVPFNVVNNFKMFLTQLGSSNFISNTTMRDYSGLTQPPLQDFPLENVEQQAIILINTNLRLEYPLLNLRLRTFSKQNEVFSFGYTNSSFIQNLGSISTLLLLINAKAKITKLFTKYEFFTIYFGNFFTNSLNDYSSLLNFFLNQISLYNSNIALYYLPLKNSSIASSILHFSKTLSNSVSFTNITYLLHADNFISSNNTNDLVIYQGTHGDKGASSANVLYPTSTLFESSEAYSYSLDGSINKYNSLQVTPLNAKLDSTIFNALLTICDIKHLSMTPYKVNRLFTKNPEFSSFLKIFPITKTILQPLHNFYSIEAITRASRALALASARFANSAEVRGSFRED